MGANILRRVILLAGIEIMSIQETINQQDLTEHQLHIQTLIRTGILVRTEVLHTKTVQVQDRAVVEQLDLHLLEAVEAEVVVQVLHLEDDKYAF